MSDETKGEQASGGSLNKVETEELPDQKGIRDTPTEVPDNNSWRSLHWNKIKNVGVHEWLMVTATIAMAISTGIYTHFANMQLQTMQNTLAEMKAGGQSSTEQNWHFVSNLNWLARTMEHSLREAQEARSASENQSRAALNASIDISRNDRRAWVGVSGFNSVNVQEGATDLMTVVLTNSGKTPAVRLKTVITGKTIPPGDPFIATYAPPVHVSNSVIQPGAQSPIIARADAPVGKLSVERFKDKSLTLYVYGKVEYQDIFGRPHFTHFCGTIDPGTQDYIACNTYNEAN